MIRPANEGIEVWLCVEPVDFRKQITGLATLVQDTLAVETFWRWCREQCHRPELLPKSPLAKALNYAMERRSGLGVFLDDPAVAIDTNHLYADNRFMPNYHDPPPH